MAGDFKAKKIVRSGRQMRAALKQIQKATDVEWSKLTREAMIGLQGDLKLLTPKDTGWAAKHWSVGLNRTSDAVGVMIDNLTNLKPGDIINQFNNVPYIARLDEGWSMQKPAGFTHIAIQKVTEDLTQRYNKLSKQEAG